MQNRRFERIAIRVRKELFGQLVAGDKTHGLDVGKDFWGLSKMGQPGQGRSDGTVCVLAQMRTHNSRHTYRFPAVMVVMNDTLPLDKVVNHPRVKEARPEDVEKLFEVLQAVIEARRDEISGHDMILLEIALGDIKKRMALAMQGGGLVHEADLLIQAARPVVEVRETVTQKNRLLRKAEGHIQYARAVAEIDPFLQFCAAAARARSQVLVRVTAAGKMRLSAAISKKAKSRKTLYLRLDMAKVVANMPLNLDITVEPRVLAYDVLQAIENGAPKGFVGINVFDAGVSCCVVVPRESKTGRKAA